MPLKKVVWRWKPKRPIREFSNSSKENRQVNIKVASNEEEDCKSQVKFNLTPSMMNYTNRSMPKQSKSRSPQKFQTDPVGKR
jgi:hypothetical protein